MFSGIQALSCSVRACQLEVRSFPVVAWHALPSLLEAGAQGQDMRRERS